ncbi:hypothetical protein [Endozoicomonas arenosclerae]|uniref:hypothetical protein n=1 Tax=Endozoicomonas arenosclerae TaxID=1633495 RepID=UPI000B25776C|nr:hypothetical protein [Endozoicomonas arenosclerae]
MNIGNGAKKKVDIWQDRVGLSSEFMLMGLSEINFLVETLSKPVRAEPVEAQHHDPSTSSG